MFRTVMEMPWRARAEWQRHCFETENCNSVEITRVLDRTVTCDDDYRC